MAGIHQRVGVAIVLLGLVGSIWGLILLRGGRAAPALRSYALLLAGLLLVQGLLGGLLVLEGNRPTSQLHWVYGPATLLLYLGALLTAPRLDERGELYALLGAMLAALLLGLRAVATGGGG